MDSVRAGIVGCSRIADLHEVGHRGREDAAIVAVCDTNRRRARQRAKVWGLEKVCWMGRLESKFCSLPWRLRYHPKRAKVRPDDEGKAT